ncbi:TonB-linked outer membrane protein, SusC/RagA family [Flagellimonas taeanensis]|uniref:TonB-linked outer membrane protein, SusC/RagA family n=1 Tax=Flagellimonas taeanensis TaxID=1005926 RepID=A0A1M6UGZ8_9FLAO|nr:TonB-dependent receptor [Allomuricauda taeanensis]SFC56335.1 TonB-linked outer membrane protein, SusC/RagA family [Allomuricauda taeanensis]SHK68423.1 TonB-linked outer membrane protein, SusC/RagA family [Allomuricauda taeanensis]
MNQNKNQILAKWADYIKTFPAFLLPIALLLMWESALSATPNLDGTTPPYQITVTGTVVDNLGNPLPGTNVIVKGTTNGTQTDFDGKYTITAASDATLIFSYVGFRTIEVPINGNSTVDVAMEEDAAALDEVVVTGYGTQTRGDLTGSVGTVDVSEATKVPIVNAAEALQGRVSGVTITNNGSPGASPVVRIRGYGTGNSNDPLYIIDGVQTDDPSILNSINPADIQQMNVLKDGAAAIYGARASNGVVIITTKSGGYNLDKARVSLDMYTGFSIATNLPELLNPQQHGQMIWQSILNDGGTPSHPQYGNGANPVVPSTIQGDVPVTMNVRPNGTDWLDEINRTAITQNASITLENGNEKSKFLFSAGYLNRDGIQIHTGFKRGSVRLNSEFKVGEKIRIGQHANISFDRRSGGQSWYNFAMRMSPLVPVYDVEGNFAGSYSNSNGLANPNNPVAEATRQSNDFRKTFRVFGDIYATWDILDGLQFKTSIGGSIRAYNDRRFRALIPESPEPISTNTLTEADQDTYEWVWSNTLSYTKSFGDHSINALVGIEALDVHGKGKEISRTGYFFEIPEYYLLSNGGGAANVAYAYDNASSLYSLFGSVNYDYDGRYLLTATVRRDESSRFVGDNKSDIFPSFSAGWVVSNEAFWPDDSFVSRLKFKGSWGQLGNQTLPVNNPTVNFSVLSEQYANYVYSGSGGATQGAILSAAGNPNLKWETSETTNFGIELGFFDNRLNLSAEYFTITTKDLINQNNSLYSSTSIDAAPPYVNLGSIENKGVDATLSYSDQTDSGFSYGFDINFSSYKNEVVDLISAFQTGFGGFRTTGTVTRTQEGQPISSFYGRIVDGIFASESEVANAADQGFDNDADGVGRFRYRDLNNDGVINDDDRTFIGSPHPDFTYGVNITLGYKGFDMSAFFQGSQGNEIFNNEKVYTDFPTFFDANRSVRVLDSWTPNNLDAELPALSQSITNNEGSANSFFVEDGSYMRLKNLQIGYTFNQQVSNILGMDSVRLYLQGTNLFTITGYDGLDPELQPRLLDSGAIDNLTIGVSDNNYPLASIYSFGVNLKF